MTAAAVQPFEELEQALGDIKEEVSIKGRVRTIKPLRAGQFAEVLRAVHYLMEAGVVKIEAGADISETVAKARQEFDPLKMVMLGGDQLIRIIAAGSGLSVSDVERLDLLDMTRLTTAVFKVNLDFFDRHSEALAAAIGPLWEQIKGLIRGGETLGQPPSPASSEPATDKMT